MVSGLAAAAIAVSDVCQCGSTSCKLAGGMYDAAVYHHIYCDVCLAESLQPQAGTGRSGGVFCRICLDSEAAADRDGASLCPGR